MSDDKRVNAVQALRANILAELENMVVDLELEGEIMTIWQNAPSKDAGDVLSHTTTKIMKWLLTFVREAEDKNAKDNTMVDVKSVSADTV